MKDFGLLDDSIWLINLQNRVRPVYPGMRQQTERASSIIREAEEKGHAYRI